MEEWLSKTLVGKFLLSSQMECSFYCPTWASYSRPGQDRYCASFKTKRDGNVSRATLWDIWYTHTCCFTLVEATRRNNYHIKLSSKSLTDFSLWQEQVFHIDSKTESGKGRCSFNPQVNTVSVMLSRCLLPLSTCFYMFSATPLITVTKKKKFNFYLIFAVTLPNVLSRVCG